MSHGESFWALIMNRFRGNGLYILYEPEAGLSPTRQMALVRRIHQLVQKESQFIIATHSPILLAHPNSRILVLTETGFCEQAYEDTDQYRVTRRFLEDPQGTLTELLREPDAE
jgi:predicted ATPase